MNNERTSIAKRVTWVGFYVNLILTIFKLMAGIIGKSSAMIADGIHSLTDFITDIIVLAFINVSDNERDDNHRYGHGKFETFATLLISIALLIVGFGILLSGLTKVVDTINGVEIEQPSIIALVAAVLSILVKEGLYWYTKKAGYKINNQAVIANAWDHRSDAFSSIGTTLGISGAIFLGAEWRILDPIACIVVSIFVVKVSFKIGMPCVHELLESSLPIEIENQIIEVIQQNPEVLAFHNLKTRKIGNIYAIDIHIKLDRNISFVKSHDLASEIEFNLRELFGRQTITNIHTEPLKVK